jgi:hypothetical protein
MIEVDSKAVPDFQKWVCGLNLCFQTAVGCF